ncbi:hypothetical protein, partial [Moorena sp. SIO2C4]|uniref:hypothetical protein n=1 Tax=Moorena sp. SIO2C4 TaxID=2607824 RepID=UPI00257EC9F9
MRNCRGFPHSGNNQDRKILLFNSQNFLNTAFFHYSLLRSPCSGVPAPKSLLRSPFARLFI